jgi:hypothetical protein
MTVITARPDGLYRRCADEPTCKESRAVILLLYLKL